MGSKEKIAISIGTAAAVVLAGGLALHNTMEDDGLMHKSRVEAARTIDHVLGQKITLPGGTKLKFAPGHAGGYGVDQVAFTVKNGAPLIVTQPLSADEYPGVVAVRIPGAKADNLPDKLGWVRIAKIGADGKETLLPGVAVEKLAGTPAVRDATMNAELSHLVVSGIEQPDAQIAVPSIGRGDEIG